MGRPGVLAGRSSEKRPKKRSRLRRDDSARVCRWGTGIVLGRTAGVSQTTPRDLGRDYPRSSSGWLGPESSCRASAGALGPPGKAGSLEGHHQRTNETPKRNIQSLPWGGTDPLHGLVAGHGLGADLGNGRQMPCFQVGSRTASTKPTRRSKRRGRHASSGFA